MASLNASASSGDRLLTLRELRDRTAHELDVCKSSRDYAALATQLRLTMAEIAELEALQPDEDEPAEILRRRREERRRRGGVAPIVRDRLRGEGSGL